MASTNATIARAIHQGAPSVSSIDQNALGAIMTALIAAYGDQPVVECLQAQMGHAELRAMMAGQGGSTSMGELEAARLLVGDAALPQAKKTPAQLIEYYIAGCDGLSALADELGQKMHKIGYGGCTDARIEGLGEAAYGGGSAEMINAGACPQLATWINWRRARFFCRDIAHIAFPAGVTCKGGRWLIELPPGVSDEEFDKIVKALMQHRELSFWINSPAGQAHCRLRGLPAARFMRYSRDHLSPGALKPAEELYLFTPRRDSAWFATILGQALDLARGASRRH